MTHTTTDIKKIQTPHYTSTRNACKLCSPLGASVAFKGIKGCVPLIHGSQGCATYIRRYLISHYREPIDIASSNFSESSTIFGGNKNFCIGIDNIINQYKPEVVAIASTCLSETIGEDLQKLIFEYETTRLGEKLPKIFHANTPAYQGTHMDGFHAAVLSAVKSMAKAEKSHNTLNIFSGFISPEDIRHIKEILTDFEAKFILLPDYSESLDNTTWETYKRIPEGGTPKEDIAQMGSSMATIELGDIVNKKRLLKKGNSITGTTPGNWLEKEYAVKSYSIPFPIGIGNSDKFFELLEQLTGRKTPEKYAAERGRLVDAFIDGHKHMFDVKAVVYGEEDYVLAMVSFLEETGIKVALAATGARSGLFESKLNDIVEHSKDDIIIKEGADFEEIKEISQKINPDIFIGNSKGYYIARELKKPLVRVGFPIHDRFGAQRVLSMGYRGTQQLYDKIINAIIEYKQDNSPVGYKYM